MSEFDSNDNCVKKDTYDNISNENKTSYLNATDTVYITDNTSVNDEDDDNVEYLIIDENDDENNRHSKCIYEEEDEKEDKDKGDKQDEEDEADEKEIYDVAVDDNQGKHIYHDRKEKEADGEDLTNSDNETGNNIEHERDEEENNLEANQEDLEKTGDKEGTGININKIESSINKDSETNDFILEYPALLTYLSDHNYDHHKLDSFKKSESCLKWLNNCFTHSRKLDTAKLVIKKIMDGIPNLSYANDNLKLPEIMAIVRSDGSYQYIVLLNYSEHNAVFYPLEEWIDKKSYMDTIPYEKGSWFCFELKNEELDSLNEKYQDNKFFLELQQSTSQPTQG